MTDPENATIAWQPLDGDDMDEFEFNTANGRLEFKAAPDFEDAERGGDNEYDVTLSVAAGGDTTGFDVAVTVTNRDEPGMLSAAHNAATGRRGLHRHPQRSRHRAVDDVDVGALAEPQRPLDDGQRVQRQHHDERLHARHR